MLQMNCPNCSGLIESPHLVEVQLFLCPQCEEIVVVENVVIAEQKKSTNFFSSLINLLLSSKEKFQLNKSRERALQEKYEIDKRLAKYLRRDDFRLSLSHDYFVDITFDNHKRSARLINISSTGAAIEFFELGPLPEDDSETTVQLLLPGKAEPLLLFGRVVWSGKLAKTEMSPTIITGLQFMDIDENARTRLWDFIVNNETSAFA